jgi:hypothetical protein
MSVQPRPGSAMRRGKIAFLFLAVVLGQVTLAVQAHGAEELPFRGSDAGDFAIPENCSDGSLQIVITGIGHATQVGRYAYSASECFDPVSGIFAGSSTLTAANGDSLLGSYVGRVSGTTDPNVVAYVEELEISGGTGRFVGVTGTLQVTGEANLATAEYTQTLVGTVARPRST